IGAAANAHEQVGQILRQLNRAWIDGQFDRLKTFLHPEVIIATPGFGERVHGSDAYVSGHRDFVASVTIHGFSESASEIDVIDDVAVVNYRYELDYERACQRYASTGRDLYVLRKTNDRWLVVWRTILDVDERVV
ncbi:MAG: nuclear transport factor 2 family protein, partial [Gammaproteobacteria bacterium]